MDKMFTYTDEEWYPVPGVCYVCTKRTHRFYGWPIWVSYIG
jgi:hypothetical protein